MITRIVFVQLVLLISFCTIAYATPYGPQASSTSQSGFSGPFSGLPSEGPVAQPGASGQGVSVTNTPPPVVSQSSYYVPGNHQQDMNRHFIGTPAWGQQGQGMRSPFPPFGANLFMGNFAKTYYAGVNADYRVMPGDRILIHIWGSYNYSDTLMVDQQGNIFVPEVGTVHIQGTANASLSSALRQHISTAFKANIEVYANLLTAQPTAVYVTGYVNRPGHYAGGGNDTLLYYLDSAGGIIPERGSYRDITIVRGGQTVARADLYSFIIRGKLPGQSLRDGDVIVVGPKGKGVVADGLIPQRAVYESVNKIFTGKELMQYAAPLPAASHVSVIGTRNAAPFHIYTDLKDFTSFTLSAGDTVEFLAEKTSESILVSVSGSTVGATRYPIRNNVTLRELLAHIPVNPQLSNLNAIYIKRQSVATLQRKAISDSLQRLEKSLLTASSATQEGAAIRVQEAQLIQEFTNKVLELEPNGVVVVCREGVVSDIILEDGDEVVIPQRSDVITISGEVSMPKSVVYTENYSLDNYIADAGGFTDRADKSNILIMHPNGEIVSASSAAIQPGDMVLIMPSYDSKDFTVFKDIMQVVYQVAVATAVLVAL